MIHLIIMIQLIIIQIDHSNDYTINNNTIDHNNTINNNNNTIDHKNRYN